jgi:ATP-dependent RNA helicase SUPV3L1/SUV3
LYQNGEVDYLVATDAIGMGLNMDINHVALAAIRKYDGQKPRHLRKDEIAQIAGRAGRFRSPGTFGVTDDIAELDPKMVEAIENNIFDPLTQIRWRNPDLEFKNIDYLLKSLTVPPPDDIFIGARQADDHNSLLYLSKNPVIHTKAQSRDMTHLLWDICAIPDFRKTLTDEHPKLLEQIFTFLTEPPCHLPEDWIADHIDRLRRTEGDLDTLLTRIAYTRTWTYITHVKGWLRDSEHWQAVTRQIEDQLSDALHEKLTQRFIDKRTSTLLRGLASRDKLLGGVKDDGTVIVEGHIIGRIKGWHFMADTTMQEADKDAVMRTARTVLIEPLQKAVIDFTESDAASISLSDTGQIEWQVNGEKIPVAGLIKGTGFYGPKIRLLHNDLLEEVQNKILVQKIEEWLNAYLRKTLGGLMDLEKTEVKGVAKGIAFQLYEHGGVMLRSDVQAMLGGMDKDERKILGNLGIKLGAYYIYHRDSLKPAAMQTKAALYRVYNNLEVEKTKLPSAGNVSMAAPEQGDRAFYRVMGLPVFGKTCVRVDMVERLNSAVFDGAKDGKYKFDPSLASTIGVSVETIHAILHDLGFRFDDITETTGEGEEAKTTTARFYHVKRKPPKLEEKAKFQKFEKTHKKFDKGLSQKKDEVKVKAQTGYNAFAGLAALKKSEN